MQAFLKSRLDTDLSLAVKAGNPEAATKALGIVKDKAAPTEKRAALIQALAESGNDAVVPVMLTILGEAGGIRIEERPCFRLPASLTNGVSPKLSSKATNPVTRVTRTCATPPTACSSAAANGPGSSSRKWTNGASKAPMSLLMSSVS